MVVMKALKKFKILKAVRLRRQMGLYRATIYYEPVNNENTWPQMRVEVFGEYSRSPWQERTPLQYDYKLLCWKCDIDIKIGQQFKFVLENGQRYVVSGRYYQ